MKSCSLCLNFYEILIFRAPGSGHCSAAAEFPYSGRLRRLENKKGRQRKAASFAVVVRRVLFQLRRDAAEARVQLGADAVHGSDNRNRDAGGDEAVFDGRRSGLILPKSGE